MNGTIEEFAQFEEAAGPDIQHVMTMLSEPIADDPTQCLNDLREIEAWYARMVYILAEANSQLDTFASLNLPAKEGLTEYDRKIRLDALCAPVRGFRDKVQGIADGIRQRITLGRAYLSYHKELNVASPVKKPGGKSSWTSGV